MALQQGLGMLLVISGASKVTDQHKFRESMEAMGLSARWLLRVVPVALPPTEIVLGVLLTLDWAPFVLLPLVGVMLVAFSLVLSISLAKGRQFDCGCFGERDGAETTWWAVVRNAVLMATVAVSGYVHWEGSSPGASLLSTLIAVALILGLSLARAAVSLSREH